MLRSCRDSTVGLLLWSRATMLAEYEVYRKRAEVEKTTMVVRTASDLGVR